MNVWRELQEYATPRNLLVAGAAYYAFYYVGREGYLGPGLQHSMAELHKNFMAVIGHPLSPAEAARYGV